MNRRMLAILIAALVGSGTTMAPADTVTLRGSSLALPGCTVLRIEGGQIVFDGPAGRRQQPLEEIAALGFDALPELDVAEEAVVNQDYDTALRHLLRTMLKATDDLQRKWIRARLVVVHDARGEYVQAAGHFGALLTLEDHPSWKRLSPISDPDRPAYPAAKEAYDHLRDAKKSVRSSELARIVDTLLREVGLAQAAAERTYEGPALRKGVTISGFTQEEILDDAASPAVEVEKPARGASLNPIPAEPPADMVTDEESTVPAQSSKVVPEPASEPEPEAESEIETLLHTGDFERVVATCTRQLSEADRDDRPTLLLTCGRALIGLDRPEDAAIMFTRCAVLHPDSTQAAQGLIETARIYETVYHRADAAERLLRLAIQHAEHAGDRAQASVARSALQRLEDGR